MARYLLDTNIPSDLVRNPQGRAAQRVAGARGGAVCTSIIVASELRLGCARSSLKRLLRAAEAVLGEIAVLPFDVPADAALGGIRAALEAAGRAIGGNDLLVAAHASALGVTLVTANAGEFERVRGLKVANWLARAAEHDQLGKPFFRTRSSAEKRELVSEWCSAAGLRTIRRAWGAPPADKGGLAL